MYAANIVYLRLSPRHAVEYNRQNLKPRVANITLERLFKCRFDCLTHAWRGDKRHFPFRLRDSETASLQRHFKFGDCRLRLGLRAAAGLWKVFFCQGGPFAKKVTL